LRPALERASARETAMRVAVGAVCKRFLAQFDISVGGYVASIGGIMAEFDDMAYAERFSEAEKSDVRCPVQSSAERMRRKIEEAIRGKNTVGGVLEIVALNLPVGLGSPAQWDKRLEARLAQAIMSVQAIKGFEVGDAFANARLPGTEAQDAIRLDRGRLIRSSNRAGGIEGGISNGQPIVIRAAMKPIATTLSPQLSVDLSTGKESQTKYERSDFCPVPRAVPILEAMVAFVLADALIDKLGGDSIAEMMPRFGALREATLEDLPMDDMPHVFWE
jgi:chorismate synthase